MCLIRIKPAVVTTNWLGLYKAHTTLKLLYDVNLYYEIQHKVHWSVLNHWLQDKSTASILPDFFLSVFGCRIINLPIPVQNPITCYIQNLPTPQLKIAKLLELIMQFINKQNIFWCTILWIKFCKSPSSGLIPLF